MLHLIKLKRLQKKRFEKRITDRLTHFKCTFVYFPLDQDENISLFHFNTGVQLWSRRPWSICHPRPSHWKASCHMVVRARGGRVCECNIGQQHCAALQSRPVPSVCGMASQLQHFVDVGSFSLTVSHFILFKGIKRWRLLKMRHHYLF